MRNGVTLLVFVRLKIFCVHLCQSVAHVLSSFDILGLTTAKMECLPPASFVLERDFTLPIGGQRLGAEFFNLLRGKTWTVRLWG